MSDFVYPQYGGNSIVSVPSTVLKHFGCDFDSPVNSFLENRLTGFDKVVFLFVDALGYDQLRAEKGAVFFNSLLNYGSGVTACFPSTTAVSVASFVTGLTPQQHGILGYDLRVEELGGLVNLLKYYRVGSGESVSVPSDFFPFKTVGEKLKEKDVGAFSVIPKEICGTVFSDFTMRGFDRNAYVGLNDFFNKISCLLDSSKKMFIHAYIPSYDSVCHFFGPENDVSRHHLCGLSSDVGAFVKDYSKKDCLLVISADHGQIQTSSEGYISYKNHPEFLELLTAIGGESRMNYLYCKPGVEDLVVKYFNRYFSDFAVLLSSADALNKGLFGLGGLHKNFNSRVGDFVVVAKKNYHLSLVSRGFYGLHGGLSRKEMCVPLMTCII